MLWRAEEFPKTIDTQDLLSFDPGLVNAGVIHVRVDMVKKEFCVLHAALINVRNPFRSFSLQPKQPVGSRKKKPEHVEPFSSCWPDINFSILKSNVHIDKISKAEEDLEKEDLKFEDQVALLPFALQSVDWLNGSDQNLDYVLIEVQDPVNAKMRSVGHSVQTYYESLNARVSHQNAIEGNIQSRQLKVVYVSSRLKLSDAVLSVLGETLNFGSDGDDELGNQLRAVISTRSHAAKKSSAVQVFKVLSDQAPPNHPFFDWISKQRSTKHNILDALLQTFSFLMQESIGFDQGLLNGTRKELQKKNAKKNRDAKKVDKEKMNALVSGAKRDLEEDLVQIESPVFQSTPKRRKITNNVSVDLF